LTSLILQFQNENCRLKYYTDVLIIFIFGTVIYYSSLHVQNTYPCLNFLCHFWVYSFLNARSYTVADPHNGPGLLLCEICLLFWSHTLYEWRWKYPWWHKCCHTV